jgi:ribosomal-protein-alanine N-acetyltransferase
MYFITTERLRLRPYTLADAPFSLRLVNSAPWLDFIGDRKIYDLPAAEAYIQNRIIKLYKQFGFGMYLVEDRYSGEPLGSCGLGKREELPHPGDWLCLLTGGHWPRLRLRKRTGCRRLCP